jgi:adenylate kinase
VNLIFLGPPGSGKGTQAFKLSEKLGMTHLSTGDILRDAVKNKTELGLKAEEYMNRGDLVPDELIIGLIEDKVKSGDLNNGFILDGFPRTLPQAEALKNMLTENMVDLDKAILFFVEDEEIVQRMSGRRSCPKCKAGYNMNVDGLKPVNDSLCDNDGCELMQREDDKEETVRNRLEIYKKQTQPIEEYYRAESILEEINAQTNPEDVFKVLLDKVV